MREQQQAHVGQQFIGTNNIHQGLHPRWCTAGLGADFGRCSFFGRTARITEATIAVPPM